MPYKTGAWGSQAKERSKRRREYFKKYRKQHPQKYDKANLLRVKKYQQNNPEKILAQNQSRFIKIPKGQKCEICKENLAVVKHHPDYSKPLQVQFLCRRCHYDLEEVKDE